jgi:hypothetical protein
MKNRILVLRSAIVASALLHAGIVVMAQDVRNERRTAIGVHVGLDPVIGGQFVRGAETNTAAGTAIVRDRSFSDVYEQAWTIGAEVSYLVADRSEAFARLTYTRAASRGLVEFRESVLRFPLTRIAVAAEFTDYQAIAIEGGFRRYLRSTGAVRPYVGGTGGAAIVPEIRINPPVRVPPGRGPGTASNVFFTRSVVPTIGGTFGLSFNARPDLHLRIEAGLRYQGRPEPEPPDEWTGPWLNDIYDGLRWSVPITGSVQFRF